MAKRLWEIGAKPVVIAHRGGGHEEPENSLTAFRAMRDRGFRYIETDVRSTKDGVAVIFHDRILDRVTDATGEISAMRWQDLATVRDRSGNRPLRLDEVLEEFPHMVFNIDVKANSAVNPLISTLKRSNAVDRVSVASFSEKRLTYLRAQLPGVRSSLGVSAIVRLTGAAHGPQSFTRLAMLGIPDSNRGVECVQVPRRRCNVTIVTERFVNLAHHRGMAVHVWTVNSVSEMRNLLSIGIDGLITDEPSSARGIIDDFWASKRLQ